MGRYLVSFIVVAIAFVFLVVVILENSFKAKPIIQKVAYNGRKHSCKNLLQRYLKLTVTDDKLNKLITLCKKDDYFKDGVKLNMSFLNFCLSSAKQLKRAKPLVALASFPGSGNSMTRALIETVTGIKTGDIYIGLCPSRGHVFVVKTHKTDGTTNSKNCRETKTYRLNYVKAIYIIRNPYDALLAEYNRQHIRNNNQIPILSTGRYFGEPWKTFVCEQVQRWKAMTIYWLNIYKNPVHLLVYEEVVNNRFQQISYLAKFLDNNITFKSLYCTFSDYVETRKRKHAKWLSEWKLFDIYDISLRVRVNSVILSTQKVVNLTTLNSYLLPVSEENTLR